MGKADDAEVSVEVEADTLAGAMAEATATAEAGGFGAFNWTGATLEKTEQRAGYINEPENRWTVTIGIERKKLKHGQGS